MNVKTFKEVSKEWLELKKLSAKYPSVMKYKSVIDNHLINTFKDYKVVDFNDDVIIAYFHYLFNEKKYSNSTLLTIRYVLKSIIEYSHQKYMTNTCSFKLIKIVKKRNEIVALSKTQKMNLSDYCFNHYKPICLSISISLYAGLRLGEICALKWEDINFKEHYIYVCKTVERLRNKESHHSKTSLYILEPKTYTSKRIVPIPSFLNNYLKEYKNYYRTNDKSSYILTGNDKIPDPRTTQYRFNKLCDHFHFHTNFHTLRHSYATGCVMNNVDTKSLSEILGHSSVGTTLNLYVHSSFEFKQKQINKISRL